MALKARYLSRAPKVAAPSVDDLMEAVLTEAAVAEAIKMIRPWVQARPSRVLASLTKEEVTSLAQGMIAAWIVKRSELEAEDAKLNDNIDDLWRA